MIDVPRILCPVDFSDVSRRALAYAAATARWYQSELTVLHVVPELVSADVLPPLAQAHVGGATVADLDRPALLASVEAFVDSTVRSIPPARVVLRDEPDAAQAILDEASAAAASLIVMGTHGRTGLDHLIVGSVAEQVLRHARVPVMVVPRQASHVTAAGDVDFDSIVCAIDFGEASRRAARWAVSLAEEADGRLSMVHVITVPPEGQPHEPGMSDEQAHAAVVADGLTRLRALVPPEVRPYLRPETVVEEGNPARVILDLADDRLADIIVLGVQERSAFDRLLRGSVTHAILHEATVPVLSVPAA